MTTLSESVTLPAEPTSARQGRLLTARLCQQAALPTDLTDTAVLLTSETVTNAVLHGRSQARLTVAVWPTGVRVEVGDDNSRHPTLQTADPDALDGRGMALLDRCATTWGVRPDPYGKIVWFELATG